MASIKDVLAWLNYADSTHITRSLRPMAATDKLLNSKEFQKDEVDKGITQAINTSQRSTDPLEYPEVCIRSGMTKRELNQVQESKNFFKAALVRYSDQDDKHRKAVTQWMLGYVEWELSENNAAISNWWEARKIFSAFLEEYAHTLLTNDEHDKENAPLKQKIEWYKERLFTMDVDLAHKFEEAYTWLNGLKKYPSHFSPPNERLRDIVKNLFKNNDTRGVIQKLEEMQSISAKSPEYLEKPEVLCFCSLFYYQLNKEEEMVVICNLSYLPNKEVEMMKYGNAMRLACELFLPESHQRAVALWMLGIIYWGLPNHSVDAILSWHRCIDIFHELEIKADLSNDRPTRKWYQDKIKIMHECLEEKQKN